MDKGYYKIDLLEHLIIDIVSQSTIKMDKGYYVFKSITLILGRVVEISNILTESQSTIKMEKGYYGRLRKNIAKIQVVVAIHNKNGKGLLLHLCRLALACVFCLSQSTIKMEKGYYIRHHHCGIKHS